MNNDRFILIIFLFILSLGLTVSFGFKDYNESYEHTVTTYTECLQIIYPEKEESDLRDRALNDLKIYKGSDSLIHLSRNITILKIKLEAQKENNEQIDMDFGEVFNLEN